MARKPRKPRDYKAEEKARKDLAVKRGYRNRYEQRHAIETGKIPAIQPSRLRNPKTIAAQKLVKPPESRAVRDALKPLSDEDRCRVWSGRFARIYKAQYHPDRAEELGVSREAYTRAYLAAFVDNDPRYVRPNPDGTGADPDQYYWYVTLNDYMEADEYESRYGPQG